MPLGFGRIKDIICAFRLVKGGTFWKFVIILFHKLIVSEKKRLHLASYFVKSIRVITYLQKSAVLRQVISEVGRGHVVFNLVNLKNAPAPTTVR